MVGGWVRPVGVAAGRGAAGAAAGGCDCSGAGVAEPGGGHDRRLQYEAGDRAERRGRPAGRVGAGQPVLGGGGWVRRGGAGAAAGRLCGGGPVAGGVGGVVSGGDG